jgi:opacity protein-like surface antigen
MKKGSFAVLALALMLGMAATPAQAQLWFGPQVSWGDDRDIAIGGKIGAAVASLGNAGARKNVDLMGAFDYFLDCDECSYFEITGGALYNFDIGESIGPYAGGGLNYGRISVDSDSPGVDDFSDSEIGLALMGGLRFLLGTLNADAGARITVGGAEQAVLSFAILFGGGR